MDQVCCGLNHLRHFSCCDTEQLKVAGVATVKTQVCDTGSGGTAAQNCNYLVWAFCASFLTV